MEKYIFCSSIDIYQNPFNLAFTYDLFVSLKSSTFFLDNYYIPANTEVVVNIYDLHRDPNYWPEPDKYDPDRFLPEHVRERHLFAYIPFSAGIRNCVGE